MRGTMHCGRWTARRGHGETSFAGARTMGRQNIRMHLNTTRMCRLDLQCNSLTLIQNPMPG